MPGKNLIIIIEAIQPYITSRQFAKPVDPKHRLTRGAWKRRRAAFEQDLPDLEAGRAALAQNNPLFHAITNTYIPLINMFHTLRDDEVPFKLSLVMSPALCTLLSDRVVAAEYSDFLEHLIKLGELETERQKDTLYRKTAEAFLNKINKTKQLFTETYNKNLLGEIKAFEREGFLELIPTAATYAYLPHYADMPEAVNAQIETGLYAQRFFFGEKGDGFYIPYKAWSPVLSKALRSYDINYTVLDARSLLFSPDCPEKGIFAPVRTKHSLEVFGADLETPADIEGPSGFMNGDSYLSSRADIGFELEKEQYEALFGKDSVRVQTGLSYLTNESSKGRGAVSPAAAYDEEKALAAAARDAERFCEAKGKKLSKAKALLGDEDALLVCTIPARLLGQTWREGVFWLEDVFRYAHKNGSFTAAHCGEMLSNQFSLPKVSPYPCSSYSFGYGEDLIDSSNSRLMRYVRKATARMIHLTEMFPSETSLKERLLNLAAKEVILAQSSAWPVLLHEGSLVDCANALFKDEIITFTKVFESLASDSVSTEWLTDCERKNEIFPWLNYRIFSKKL